MMMTLRKGSKPDDVMSKMSKMSKLSKPPPMASKMETAPLRKRTSVTNAGSSWRREPPTPPSVRGW
jgi:hypothetical protein